MFGMWKTPSEPTKRPAIPVGLTTKTPCQLSAVVTSTIGEATGPSRSVRCSTAIRTRRPPVTGSEVIVTSPPITWPPTTSVAPVAVSWTPCGTVCVTVVSVPSDATAVTTATDLLAAVVLKETCSFEAKETFGTSRETAPTIAPYTPPEVVSPTRRLAIRMVPSRSVARAMARPLPSASTSSPSVSVTATSPALCGEPDPGRGQPQRGDGEDHVGAGDDDLRVAAGGGGVEGRAERAAERDVGDVEQRDGAAGGADDLGAVEGQVGGAVAEPDDGAGPVAEQQPDVRGGEVDGGAGLLDGDVAGERLPGDHDGDAGAGDPEERPGRQVEGGLAGADRQHLVHARTRWCSPRGRTRRSATARSR